MKMIHIAHLSDLHFGAHFSPAMWGEVERQVIRFEPDLIIVSGDLVDHPSPEHLLAAKCALHALSQKARQHSANIGSGRAAELVVVPGNHDVFETGLAFFQKRLRWFERVFHSNDTNRAERNLERRMGGGPLGFTERCRDCTSLPSNILKRLKLRAEWQGYDKLLPDPEVLKRPKHVYRPAAPVLLALLDSNPTRKGADFATGVVSREQLFTLGGELQGVSEPYLARIAVVHHHVLPIAFAGGPGARREPMMVLRNAGAVLQVLADHKFDLILHGHWHTPQFARLSLGTPEGQEYPISVAAAGSAALDNSPNCFNLIKIHENGRIVVTAVFYGGERGPNLTGENGVHFREYREPIAAVKRRAFSRALERHKIKCSLRRQKYSISENGDLWIEHGVEGLLLLANGQPCSKRQLRVFNPPDGQLVEKTLTLDKDSLQAGMRLERDANRSAATDAENIEQYWVWLRGRGLVPGEAPHPPYSVTYACANCITMTRWEAAERAREKGKDQGKMSLPDGWDEEWVGLRVLSPSDEMDLSVTFPESMKNIHPYLTCFRHPEYPVYDTDELGDAKMPHRSCLVSDWEMRDKEVKQLGYNPQSCTWHIRIERPIVGYDYELRWRIPGEDPDPGTEGETRQLRRSLLALSDRVANQQLRLNDGEAIEIFNALTETLTTGLRWSDSDEDIVSLWVYDESKFGLRPVLSHRSWSDALLPNDFTMGLGKGVAGVAFQQRRILPWSKQWSNIPIIQPILDWHDDPEKRVELVNMLALPVYHPKEAGGRPPPWATIGVVSYGSSSVGSKVCDLGNPTKDVENKLLEMWQNAQIDAIRLLAKLRT